MFKEAITSEPLEEQLHGALSARLLRSRLQVNAALCSDLPLRSDSMRIGLVGFALATFACGGPKASSRALDASDSTPAGSTAAGTWAAIPAEPGPPPWPLPAGTWWPLAGDSVTRVSLDTLSVIALPTGEYRVRLLYQFVEPRRPSSGVPIYVLVSDEETDCAQLTARVFAVTVFDTLGREQGRITQQPASGPPSMVGAAGPPLCFWLRGYAVRNRANAA